MGFSIYIFLVQVAAGGKTDSSSSSDQNYTGMIFSVCDRNCNLDIYTLKLESS